MNKLLKTLGVLAAFSLLAAAGFVAYDFLQTRDKFPTPTFIGNIAVSNLTEKEAVIKLARFKTSEIFSPLITFEAEKYRYSFSPESIGVRVNYVESVGRAYDETHKEGYLKELRERLRKEEVSQPPVINVNDEQLHTVIGGMGDEIRSTAKDASIVLYEETGGFHIESEDLGREVSVKKTADEFKKRLLAGGKIFPIIISYIYPKISEKDLRAFPPVYRIAAYTTYYGRHDSPNRIHNIKLIASWLDGTMLLPNDEFSLADAIGDFTPERGFKEAFVIFQGVLVPQLGGGTCQIGTTLYNAISLADLQVQQRSNHSFYFNIYPLGRDATVYPGQKDLKFKNNTGHVILIKAVATNKRLSFRIYGTPTGKKVEFSAPAVYILTKSGYEPSSVRAVLDADSPFKTSVVRKVFDSTGKQLKEETIHSYYKLYGEKSNVPIARPEPR